MVRAIRRHAQARHEMECQSSVFVLQVYGNDCFYTNLCTLAVLMQLLVLELRKFELLSKKVYKSNFSLYLLHYAKACNELAGPVSDNRAPFETNVVTVASCCQQSTVCPIWLARDLNFQTSRSGDKCATAHQLDGNKVYISLKTSHYFCFHSFFFRHLSATLSTCR